MNITDGSLRPFLFSRLVERDVRAKLSEGAILQVHDVAYSPVKEAVGPASDAMEGALADELGFDRNSSAKDHHRRAITNLRALLNRDAKERELQDALVASGLLAVTCKAIQEVAMQVSDDHRGMRMDLVLESTREVPAQIIELKRGSHLLLAKRGKPTQRLSMQLTRAIKQLQGYGHRLESDVSAVESIEKRHGIQIHEPELRLVAGRRLSDASEYRLLSAAETQESGSGPQLQIYTWDGFMTELERILE